MLSTLRLFCLFILFSVASSLSAQQFSIEVSKKSLNWEKGFEREMRLFRSLYFTIKGQIFQATDTTRLVLPITQHEFDTVYYVYENSKGQEVEEHFICKFRKGERYVLSPCTCCGFFLLTAASHPKRGFVSFDNKSKQTFIAMASDFDYTNLTPQTRTEDIYSSISMNCGFRPNCIFIAHPNYINKAYHYKLGLSREELKRRELQREKEICYQFNYLFLHKERLVVTIDETGKFFDVQLR